MSTRMLVFFLLFSYYWNTPYLQAQNDSTQEETYISEDYKMEETKELPLYEAHNTWSSATEEIEELPFIIGTALIRELKINSIAILVKTLPINSLPTSLKHNNSTSFGGLIGFNEEGLKTFSSSYKVLDWETHRPKPSTRNILVPKNDNYFPIRSGSLYYSYPSKHSRTVSFFFERYPDSIPDGYLNCIVRQRAVKYEPPQHLVQKKALPEKQKKEQDNDLTYSHEKTDEGLMETITNKQLQSYKRKNLYNKKKQLVSTYEITSPFRVYIEEHFYEYNKLDLVERDIRLYHDRGMIIRDTSRYKYNPQGKLIESLRNSEYGFSPEEFKPHGKVHATYYYNMEGLLENKVISDLSKNVRFVCTYIYNPSSEAIMNMP